jgi:hypothetical protein
VTGLGHTLATFPNFVAYFAVGGVLTALFVALYSNLTPHREIALIRAGNVAAAIALSSALVGFVIPLASVVAHSAGIIDRLGHRRLGGSDRRLYRHTAGAAGTAAGHRGRQYRECDLACWDFPIARHPQRRLHDRLTRWRRAGARRSLR